jgi:Ca2+-binding RTX toxin-like protein
MRLRHLTPGLIVLALLAVPAAASASTLTRAAGAYDYTGSGSTNQMQITGSLGSFSITDIENITMAADASCTGENTMNITCTVTPTSIDVDLGGGNDTGNVGVNSITAAIPLTGQGGSGNDNLSFNANFGSGSPAASIADTSGTDNLSLGVTSFNGVITFGYGTVSAGTGDDIVAGTATVNGDAGKDLVRGLGGASSAITLNGGTEDDVFQMNDSTTEIVNGGAGNDIVDYSSSNGVTVTLDTIPNDGQTGPGQVDNANLDASVEGIKGSQGIDFLTGGGSNDVITGGPGNDTLNGLAGDDYFDGQDGADTINGGVNGFGGDLVDYSSRDAAIRILFDGIANDGVVNEGDNLGSDIENVNGGFDNDYIIGNTSDNVLNGGPGDDELDGQAANDTLNGGFGDDRVDGGPGIDTLTGARGDDTLDGGTEADTLFGDQGADLVDGGPGADNENGGSGSDTILTKDNIGGDIANCGDSTDHAVTDLAGDTVNADCEISDSGQAGFGAIDEGVLTTAPPTQPTPAVAGSSKSAVVTCIPSRTARGRIVVKCTVALADDAAGKLRGKLLRGKRIVAKASRSGSGQLTLRTAKNKRAKRGRYTLQLAQGKRSLAKVKIKVG